MAGCAGDIIGLRKPGCRIIAGGVADKTGPWLALGIPGFSKNRVAASPAMRATLPGVINAFMTVDAAVTCHFIAWRWWLRRLGLSHNQRYAGCKQSEHQR